MGLSVGRARVLEHVHVHVDGLTLGLRVSLGLTHDDEPEWQHSLRRPGFPPEISVLHVPYFRAAGVRWATGPKPRPGCIAAMRLCAEHAFCPITVLGT